jgi:2-polyprenyl-3-methyl-5-hydroxy-6-metoxy-1,4-benzoquinol methylase
MQPIHESIRALKECRLCGSLDLARFIDFGQVPLGNNLQLTAQQAKEVETYKLDVMRCNQCSHFQLGHGVSPELLYATNYTYLSGIGSSFVKHIAAYEQWIYEHCDLPLQALVVDIGSNDGTCLKAFQNRGYTVCGVDPASLAAGIANDNGIPTINSFFDSAAVQEITNRYGQADFVTSQNVLAHVDDLGAVFRNIYDLLKDGGFFAFEIGYFREVLLTGCFDTIYHEHLDYHHAGPLARHLCALGFDLIDLSVNSVQGGSLRLLLKKTGNGDIAEQAQNFLGAEKQSVLCNEEFLNNWPRKIESSMVDFHNLLAEEACRGARIVAYGAPTKATLLTKLAKLGASEIAFVVEDNPHKVGRFLPGSCIPIYLTSELILFQPEVIVLLAWNFADDIIAKLRGKFNAPVKVVIPLPDLRVINI